MKSYEFGSRIEPHSEANLRNTYDTGGAKSAKQQVRKRILVVTPFSPLREHGHAADDLGEHLVKALSSEYDVDVYAPGQDESTSRSRSTPEVTYLAGSDPSTTVLRHVGVYPAGLRKDWSRRNSREARRAIRARRPDFVHIEYLQGVESVLGESFPTWSLTLHDVTSTVFRQRAAAATGVEKFYRWCEYFRVNAVERKAAKKASHIFTLSTRDAEWVRRLTPSQSVSHLKIGIGAPDRKWVAPSAEYPTFVFAGAMWREPNVAAAEWLTGRVMPLVWQKCPNAVLRIVGSRPADRVSNLAEDPRIEVVGRVDSLDDEYLESTAVLAPTVVNAGVLLKALRGFACGAPVILNDAAAEPLEVLDGVHCYVSNTASGMASRMLSVWTSPIAAQVVASAGASYVREKYSWENYGREMIQKIGRL